MPHTPATEGLFNRARFQRMKRSAFFINIGRGMTTRLDDLVAALNAGEIAGAALDVFEQEPLPADHPLWTMPNVLLTPHMAGYGPYLNDRRLQIIIDNARRLRRRRAAAQPGGQGELVLNGGTMNVVVTYAMEARGRGVVAEELAGVAQAVWLPDLDDAERAAALREADAVLARTTRELHPGEIGLLNGTKLLQFVTAGIDHVPLAELPEGVPVAANGGAYAEPMAEHAIAMALAAAKRLLIEHAALARGEFNQFARNRMLAGGVCGILGFGGIGVAVARLARGDRHARARDQPPRPQRASQPTGSARRTSWTRCWRRPTCW